jgi:hypothetical protein
MQREKLVVVELLLKPSFSSYLLDVKERQTKRMSEAVAAVVVVIGIDAAARDFEPEDLLKIAWMIVVVHLKFEESIEIEVAYFVVAMVVIAGVVFAGILSFSIG